VTSKRELGRGERVLPGLWRLRLPLPWPGVPHGNAWAIAAGSGVVLIDTGYYEPGSIEQLERAMSQVNLRIEHVRLLAVTHAHSDHWGQAAPIVERAGCELWMHPDHRHATETFGDPGAILARRLEIGRQSGVPAPVLDRYAERFPKDVPSGIAKIIEPDRALIDGVEFETDLGTWRAYETPGHAPSHVCLHQPERRILISGDHVLGRISLFYDYGWTPDPAGEFLRSLEVVDRLDARLGLSGHGRPFVDVRGHIAASRELATERITAVRAALAEGPKTALEIAPSVYQDPLTPQNASWQLSETLSYLTHLQQLGEAVSERDGDASRWQLTSAANLDTVVSRSVE
jgi:glyoxylase-like metal-dependent hydrolase (beta-lactamase superfamily II)